MEDSGSERLGEVRIPAFPITIENRGDYGDTRAIVTDRKASISREMPLPLDEVRVIDISSYFAGPFSAGLLANFGADVVKVEPPSGDPYRAHSLPRSRQSAQAIGSTQPPGR